MTAATYSNGVMTPGSVVALKDYRDNETYAIAKLADGRCWMIENLRLDPSTANITAALTNNPDSTFLANRTNSYSWCANLNADCGERVLFHNSAAIGGGYYYNWYTVTAGNGTYDFVGTAMGDICPAGWHIPTGHNGEFKTWLQSAGANSGGLAATKKLAVYPYNFIYNGAKENDVIYEYRERGGYWSSVASDYEDETYWVEATYTFESNPIYNGNYLAKPAGITARCIKDDVVVTYNGNGASNSTSMSVRLNVERGATVTLSASNYQRTGYGFLGWSLTQIDPDASNFATLLSNATIYGPNETITIPANASSNIVLYATWIKSAGNLQNWSGCSSMSTGGVTALKDTRDNQVYAVAKLADGNCWMIENLRLSHNSSNPDWGDPSLSQGFGGVFHGLAESEASSFAESTIANTLYTTDLSSATQYAITGENIQYRFPRYNNQNTANTVSSMTTTNQNIYSYGNYYNYSAATASTIDSSESYSSSFPGTSICPAGWILPQYSKSTFGNLQTAIADASLTNSQAFRKYPNNFIMAGSFTSGSSSNRGSTGYYTGQRNIYNGSTYQMTITTTQTATAGSGGVSVGKSVRCLTSSGLEIKLYANDGSGRVVRIYNTAGTTNALQPETFSRNNYKITSWNTAANGSGTQYTDSYTIPSGATSGITLYAQWSPTYTLVYNGNGATGTTTMSIQNIGGAEGDTVILYASNYQRSGYGFAGWSITQIDPDAANAASQIANATIFGPNESITLNSTTLGQALNGSPKTITLYAVWVKSAGNMQGWTGCSSMATNEITARRDARDGNVYAIAKLIDGNCWMIENLRLSNNATNSNWGDPTLSQGFGGVFNGLANSETTTVTASSTANSLYTQGTTSGLITISGDSLVYGDSIDYRFPRYNNINTASAEASMITSASNVYSYGNYYNPAGSIANTNLYRDATGADGSDNAGTSLCPAGWRLPKSGTNTGDIYDLDQLLKTGTNAWDYVVLRQFPQNFVMSGKYHAGRASQRGEAGYYATSSLNTNGAFNMVSIVYSGYSSVSGGSATSIRCMYGSGVEVVLNANDGSGRVARLYGTAGSTITLPDKLFARSDGYGSNRWNTTPAGTGTEYTSSYTLPTGATSANLYATWKQSYSIAYNGNGDTGGTSMAVKNKNVVEGDTVILNPSNFSRSGYGFLGWSFTQIDPDASNAATLIANATIYGPMESITAPARTDSIMTLYAVWVKSAGDMQSWAGCSSMSAGAVTARKDTRDDQVYAIAKLADGHCWMIENLRLGVSGSSSSALSQGFGGVFNGLANSESSFLTTTASNSLYGIDGSGSSFIITASTHTFIDSNNRSYDLSGYSIPRFNSTNTTSTTTSMASISANVYSFGNYYNWPAAMANTTMLTTISAAESAGTSICPKGWHLPTHGTNTKEYYTLYTSTKIDSNDTTGVGMRKYPNNFILSGYKSGSNTNDRGKEGEYWSRSLTANATSYYQSYQAGVFRIGTTNIINNSSTTIKGYGASVRCLADY